MDIKIRKLSAENLNDFMQVIGVFEEVFEMKNFTLPEEEHLQKLLQQDGFYVFVAILKNEIIGGLTAYTLQQYYSVRPLVYVYDLAVKTAHQRQGVGKKLMAAITTYCKEIGAEEVFVQADEVDDYALDFYRATGAVGEKVIHFYYPLNKG